MATYEVSGVHYIQTHDPEDLLGLELGDLEATARTLEALLRDLDLEERDREALVRTLRLVQYLEEGLSPEDLVVY